MKKLSLLLLLTISLATVQAQVANPDTMVHKLFAAIQTNDSTAYVALQPSQKVMVSLMTRMMAGVKETISQQQKTSDMGGQEKKALDSIMSAALMQKLGPDEYKKMQQKFVRDLQKIRTAGEAKGVDWTKAKLITYRYDTASLKDEAMVTLFGSDQYKGMKGEITFSAADSTYRLSFDDSIFMPEEGGWVGASPKQIIRNGEQFSSQDEEDEEVTEAVTDDVPPPPPPKPRVKTKLKAKSGPVKTKAKAKV